MSCGFETPPQSGKGSALIALASHGPEVPSHSCLGLACDCLTPWPGLWPRGSSAPFLAQKVVPFYNLGLLMALFSPRCTDSLPRVRQHAVDCVHSLLYIQLCYEGNHC